MTMTPYWQINKSRALSLYCFKYGAGIKKGCGKGIPGLHICLEKTAARDLIDALTEIQTWMKLEETVKRSDVQVARISCAGTARGFARRFSQTNRLVGFRSIVLTSINRRVPGEIFGSRLIWSEQAATVHLSLNNEGARELGKAVLDTMFLGTDDYPVPARKTTRPAGKRRSSTWKSDIWVWSFALAWKSG